MNKLIIILTYFLLILNNYSQAVIRKPHAFPIEFKVETTSENTTEKSNKILNVTFEILKKGYLKNIDKIELVYIPKHLPGDLIITEIKTEESVDKKSILGKFQISKKLLTGTDVRLRLHPNLKSSNDTVVPKVYSFIVSDYIDNNVKSSK